MDELGELLVRVSADISDLQKGLATAGQAVTGFSNTTTKTTENLTGNFTNGLRQVSRELNQLAGAFALVGAAGIAPFVAALATSNSTVVSVGDTVTKLASIGQQFGQTIATDILPVLNSWADHLAGVLQWFNALDQPTRAAIEQGIYFAAMMALATAAVLKFISETVRVIDDVEKLTVRFLSMSQAQLAVVGTALIWVAVIGLIIAAMIKWKPVADTVMTTLQVGFQSVLIIINEVALGIGIMASVVVGGLQNIIDVLAKIPGPQQKWVQQAQAGIDGLKANIDDLNNKSLQNIIDLSQKITQEVKTGTGTWAQGFDNAKQHVIEFFNAYKNGNASSVQDTQKSQSVLVSMSNQLKELNTENSNQAFLTEKNNLNQGIALAKLYQDTWTKAHETVTQFAISSASTIENGLGTAIGNIVTGTETAAQAFADLGKQMIQMVINYFLQRAVSMALDAVFGNAMLAAAVATQTAAGAAIALAYAPAAAMVSLASFGTNGPPAGAAIAAISAEALTLSRPGLATGTDTVPAMLSPGEMVIPNTFAGAIRQGNLTLGGPQGNGAKESGDTINISIAATIANDIDITQLTKDVAYETQKQLRYVRNRR